jgi:hypothetical protein
VAEAGDFKDTEFKCPKLEGRQYKSESPPERHYPLTKQRVAVRHQQQFVFVVFNIKQAEISLVQSASSVVRRLPLRAEQGLLRLINDKTKLARQLQQTYLRGLVGGRAQVEESLVVTRANTVKLHLLHSSASLRIYYEVAAFKDIIRVASGELCTASALLYTKKKSTVYDYLLEVKVMLTTRKTQQHRLLLNNFDLEGLFRGVPPRQVLARLSKFMEIRKFSIYKKVALVLDSEQARPERQYLLVNRLHYSNSMELSKHRGFL